MFGAWMALGFSPHGMNLLVRILGCVLVIFAMKWAYHLLQSCSVRLDEHGLERKAIASLVRQRKLQWSRVTKLTQRGGACYFNGGDTVIRVDMALFRNEDAVVAFINSHLPWALPAAPRDDQSKQSVIIDLPARASKLRLSRVWCG
jgi:hypothetical protein